MSCNALNRPAAVDCDLQFSWGWSVNGDRGLFAHCKDVCLLLVKWKFVSRNTKFLRLLILDGAAKGSQNFVFS